MVENGLVREQINENALAFKRIEMSKQALINRLLMEIKSNHDEPMPAVRKS